MPNDFDPTQAFLQSLPEIGQDESFRFACHPQVPCFNACCGDLNLMLTPYDALRLRLGLGMSSKDFIAGHCAVFTAPDTGFPMLSLRMTEGAGKPCPFVTAKGCSVYPNRPAACRTYPLGRATRLNEAGQVEERYFVVREPHCRGFEENRDWTPRLWLKDQGLEPYYASNDKLALLMGRQKARGTPVDSRLTGMALLGLYQPDRFREFLRDMKVFDRLEVDPSRQEVVMTNEEETLEFAMDWLELALFGQCPTLRRKVAKP